MFDTSKSNKSNNSDGGSKQSSTASSTMQSTDSGCATMYSPSMMFNAQDKYPTRPITIGPEYINMTNPSNNPHEDYINLFACSTLNKTQNQEISEKSGLPKREPPPPPPPPRMPKAKPRLNVSLSRESSIEESNSNSVKKKRPVPQPRKLSNPRQTLPPKSLSTSKVLVSSDVQPVSLPATKIYKKVVSTSSIPDPVPLPSLPTHFSSSSSSSEENDDPPALPARQRIN